MAKIDQLIVGETYRYATYTGYGIRTDRGSFGEFVHIDTRPAARDRSRRHSEVRTVRRAAFNPLGGIDPRGNIVPAHHDGLQYRSADGFDVVPFDVDEYREQRRQTRLRQADAKAARVAEARELVPVLRVLAAAGHPRWAGPFLYRDYPRTELTLRTDDELAEHLATLSAPQLTVNLLDILRAAHEVIS